MEKLLQRSARLLRNVQIDKTRYLYNRINWNNRLIGIKGARGMGKTTLMLQRLKQMNLPVSKASYWTLDDLFFLNNSLVEIATQFYLQGGRVLFLDEVHKYQNWSQHIKNLYDQYEDFQIVFSGSSIIDIAKEEVDLSRRALMYTLEGMSYREYLSFKYDLELPIIKLEELIDGSNAWHKKMPKSFKPLEFFSEYLKMGYYPFSIEDEEGFNTRLQQVIRISIEYDMVNVVGFEIRNSQKLLQLLYVLSANVPFKPNITELATKTGIHRNTIGVYLNFLEDAQLIRMVYPAGISVSTLQKPEKIYLNNTNLAFALASNLADKGNLRETFFAAQLAVLKKLTLPSSGDFVVDNTHIFEIGGKNKGNKQLEGIKNSHVVVDDQDYPVTKIPLWAFGMGY